MRKNYDFSKARRGAILPAPKGKARITIRIDSDILAWFRTRVNKAGGGNYQTLINDGLRSLMNGPDEPLETVIRRIVREELTHSPTPPPRRRKPRVA